MIATPDLVAEDGAAKPNVFQYVSASRINFSS